MREPEGFREFVEARSPVLLRTAYLLTGDHALAEDLLQTALVRVWPHWPRVRHEHPEAYVRVVMANLQRSWWQRRWRGEVPTERLPERATPGPESGRRDELVAALRTLPVGQRQVVVLRHVHDWSVAQVATALGLSEGTVKSQCARGLATLRTLFDREGVDHV